MQSGPAVDNYMTHKLTDELRYALGQTDGPIEVRDEESQKVYVISERGVFQRAMQALQLQEHLQQSNPASMR